MTMGWASASLLVTAGLLSWTGPGPSRMAPLKGCGPGPRHLAEEGIGTGITCVVTDDMVNDLPGIADMAHFYGNVHQVGFDILREQGRGETLHEPFGPGHGKGAGGGIQPYGHARKSNRPPYPFHPGGSGGTSLWRGKP